MIKDITIKDIWKQLKKEGATSENKTERVPIGYTEKDYEEIKIKGYTFEIRQDLENDCDWINEDDDCFLVNYHNDFYVRKDDIITEEEVKELYRGEVKWKKAEKEKGYWMFELSCLIHSGMWLKLGIGGFMGDAGGWDTSHVGLVLVSKKMAKTRKQAERFGEEIVDTWNKYLAGDIYWIRVKKNGEEIDNISGLLGLEEVYEWIKEYKKD